MQNFLLRLWRTLSSLWPRASREQLVGELSQLDLERWQEGLRLEERGQERGRRDLPPGDAASPDEVEKEILDRFETTIQAQLQDFVSRMKLRSRQIGDQSSSPVEAKLRALVENTRAQYIGMTSRCLDQLFRRREDCREFSAQLQDFKRKHSISRPATYPESRALLIGVVLVVLLTETIFNGRFLAQGDELGILGGVVSALVFALVNVALAWTNGRLTVPSMLHHRSLTRRAIGGMGFLIVLTIGLLWNLMIAHYRDSISAGSTSVGADTLRAMYGPVKEFESIVLLVLGVIFAAIATADGYRWDDPYPGYGGLVRNVREREQEYVWLKEEVASETAAIRDSAFAEFEELTEELERG